MSCDVTRCGSHGQEKHHITGHHMTSHHIRRHHMPSRHMTSRDTTSPHIKWHHMNMCARGHVCTWTCGHVAMRMSRCGQVDTWTCVHVHTCMSRLCKTRGSARTPFLHAILHGALGSGCSSVSHKVCFFGDRGHSVLPRIRAFLRSSLGALGF